MLQSALNYFSDNAGGFNPGAGLGEPDGIVGSTLCVGEKRVTVTSKIGEGGFAQIFAVHDSSKNCNLALKRLLAFDEEKRTLIVQEISFLKALKPCKRILQYEAAANLKEGLSAGKSEEFLLLTELCQKSIFDALTVRSRPYSPQVVAKIFSQAMEALAYLHSLNISHRDFKMTNLLIDESNGVKLCDFGSATKKSYSPNESWTMKERNAMSEELMASTTPMYRSPEICDEWSNFAVDTKCDIWSAGCTLFELCFHFHPFACGSKLKIINGNYAIPDEDREFAMFHDLIRQLLAVDPSWRPSATQTIQHLKEIATVSGWDLDGEIDWEFGETPPKTLSSPTSETSSSAAAAAADLQLPPVSGAPSSQIASSASAAISSLRGGAGSMFRNIRESSKAVVSSLLAPKDLDFHLLTSKIAAMSYPSEGIDLTFKNQIDEIRQIMEARHADHYCVVNLCERKYESVKFPRGKVFDAHWSSQIPPSVEQVLEMSMKTLEFLGQHKTNVAVIHCLDGKSNTAILASAIFIISKIFTRLQDALKFFEIKRCEPILSHGQRCLLANVEKLITTSAASVHIPRTSVSITSVIFEPVPCFTKAGDGVRPFVDLVGCKGDLIGSTLKDYNSLKLFTPYDGEVTVQIKEGVKMPPGEVTLIIYHARQSLAGSFFSSASGGKVERIKICQVTFDPSSLDSKTHVRFRTHEIDGITNLERIPADFNVSVNFVKKGSNAVKFPYLLPEKRKLELIFQSRREYEEALEFSGSEAMPSRPPREKRQPKQQQQHQQQQAVDKGNSVPQPEKPIVENILPEEKPPATKANDDNDHDILVQFDSGMTKPDTRKPAEQSTTIEGDLLGGFSFGEPKVPQPVGASGPQVPQPEGINLIPTGSSSAADTNLLFPTASEEPQNSDLLGDILSPQTPSNQNQNLVDELLSQLKMPDSENVELSKGNNETAATTATASAAAATAGFKPNYNNSFFSMPSNSMGNHASKMGTKPTEKSNFADILGDFTPASSSNNSNRSIGDMKKDKEKKAMDKDEAAIFEWTYGKSRNLRALLCSLDSVIWEGSRWNKCGMHQLVSHNDVKKMYKKACLAVHPDKQMGSKNEKLSKLIFTELNDGWSKFQDDEPQ